MMQKIRDDGCKKPKTVVRLSINHFVSLLYDMMATCNLNRRSSSALSAMQITKHHHIFMAVIVTAAVSAGFTYILVACQWQSPSPITAVVQNRKEVEELEVELASYCSLR